MGHFIFAPVPRYLLCAVLCSTQLRAEDRGCPAYPDSVRIRFDARHAAERSFVHYSDIHRTRPAIANPPARNLIDDYIFSKMARDGVQPAGSATDAELLRRVTLDVTGRIPSVDAVKAYLSNPDMGKSGALLDSLLASDAYVESGPRPPTCRTRAA